MLEGKTKFALATHKGRHTQIDFCTHLHTPFVPNMIFYALTFKFLARGPPKICMRVRVWPNISFVFSSVHKTPVVAPDVRVPEVGRAKLVPRSNLCPPLQQAALRWAHRLQILKVHHLWTNIFCILWMQYLHGRSPTPCHMDLHTKASAKVD